MARRTPGQLSTQSSVASLPLRSAVEQQQQPAPTFAPSYKAPSVEPQTKATGTRDFVLADMDGRSTRDNRACTKCIRKLAPSEVQQINWHLTEDQPCRLCAIAEGKPEAYTKPFTDFLRENPTVFHTVDHFKTKLSKLGFTEVGQAHNPPSLSMTQSC